MGVPLAITAEIAPGADPNASPSTWNWSGEGVRWRTRAGISITGGRDDEDDTVKPGAAELTLDNRDGNLSPRNVLGAWYGALRRNTPLRIQYASADDDFDRTVAAGGWGTEPTSGAPWVHSNPSFWSVSGGVGRVAISASGATALGLFGEAVGTEVDVTHVASISGVPTGAAWVHATAVRYVDPSNYYRLYTEFQTDGQVRVKIVRVLAGAVTELVGLTDAGVSFTAGTQVATRVQAVGKTLQVKVWLASGTEPDFWTASATDTTIMGVYAGLFEWRLATNPGTLTLSVDNFRVQANLFTGQVPEWPVRWPEKSGADCVTPVSASGVLRWLGQANPPLTSPITQQLSAQNPQAYWRLEDGADARGGGSAIANGLTAAITDVTFGNDDAPGGARSSAALNSAGASTIVGTVGSWKLTPQNGFGVIVYAKFPSAPAASPAMPFLEIRSVGIVTRWVVTVDAATFNVTGYDNLGNVVTTTGGVGKVIDMTQWFAFRFYAQDSPGVNVAYAMAWHQVGSTSFYGLGGSTAGTIDRATAAIVHAPVDGTLASHLWVGSQSVPFVNAAFMQVSDGYTGETDVERIARVFDDAGIEVVIESGDGIRLGPQPRGATALEVARDAEKAGFGILYERGPILGYIPASARMNPPIAMELDWAAGHMAEAPEPVDDDLELVNRWTSTRPGGSERTAEDEDSIAAERLYADGDEVNVEGDDQLEADASWHVALGTRDALRWPRITLDLVRNPELISSWLSCRIGSRITIANLPSQVAGEVADLIIEGYAQEIGKHTWRVELSCTTAAPWTQVAVWGETYGDSRSTQLAEDLDPAETSVNIVSEVYEDTWASAGGYQWKVNGETMTVVSVTAPAGTAPNLTQTATVIRDPLYAKAHNTSEPVRLASPGRWGF